MKMLRSIAQAAAAQTTEKPTGNLSFGGWRYGLNTYLPATQIHEQEACALCNLKKAGSGGQWMPRNGITENTSTAVNGWKANKFVPISGTVRELIVDADKKLYYNASGTPTRIGGSRLLSSTDVFIFAFKGVALICDTSYLKYCDGTGATGLKIAYDDGTGTSGYQYNNKTGSQDGTFALGNGTNIAIGQKITTQAWDSGFTIPPTTFSVYFSKTGLPTGSITAKLRLVSDCSVLASVTAYADVSELTGDAELVEVSFASGTVTTEMSPSTAYYLSFEYSGGDGANYVDVHYTTVSTGGLAYHAVTDAGTPGNWTNDTTEDLVCALRPGRPPKANSGEAFGNRPWIQSPDSPGGAYTGNFTYLDWSTSSYAGFVGVEDDDANSFPVGAIKSLFENDLYFFGTSAQPYLAKLSGTTFDTFKVGRLYQRQWTTKNLLTDTHNDLWYASKEGINSIAGIQQYGDLSTKRHSDAIKRTFDTYFDSTTDIAGYDASEGQFQLQMKSYHRLLIFHASKPELMPNNIDIRYPSSEYEFTVGKLSDTNLFTYATSGSGTNERYFTDQDGNAPGWDGEPDYVTMAGKVLTKGTVGSLNDHEWDYGDNDGLGYSTIYYRDDTGTLATTGDDMRALMIPQTIEHYNGVTYYGFSTGKNYIIDSTEYKDLSYHQMTFDLRSKYVVGELATLNLTALQFEIAGTTGAQLNLSIFTDGMYRTPTAEYSFPLPIDDRLDLVDYTMDLVDMYFSLAPSTSVSWKDIDINCTSFQARITDLLLSGRPVFIDKLTFKIRALPK